jgi:hypothetical protein
VALTALGVITGTTIYVLNNTRQQVKPEDVIELALGTDERAMGTQTGTNSDGTPIYAVARPSFVCTWTSNVYTTNGVTVYTNIVTNAIGWHIDRDMMVSLDTTIKALVPYYVDTNTVYDGTTNIAMLTVTGLWMSLGIGDKTNQFTRTSCWTNPVSTNWIVNYTSYWPSTNGIAVTNSYTSDWRQVVNYASSWTATGGYVWVTSSNWASSVVTVTNAATYGDYPWQIYDEDLQERYKVLNALKMTKPNLKWSGEQYSGYDAGAYPEYSEVYPFIIIPRVENLYVSNTPTSVSNATVSYLAKGSYEYMLGAPQQQNWNLGAYLFSDVLHIDDKGLSTNFSGTLSFYVLPTAIGGANYTYPTNGMTGGTYNDDGHGWQTGKYNFVESSSVSDGVAASSDIFDSTIPDWNSHNFQWPQGPGFYTPPYWYYIIYYSCKATPATMIDWQFNYCTNKYW